MQASKPGNQTIQDCANYAGQKTRAVSGWQGLEAREVGSPNSWSYEIKPSPVFLKMLQLALDEFWTLANVQEFRNDQK